MKHTRLVDYVSHTLSKPLDGFRRLWLTFIITASLAACGGSGPATSEQNSGVIDPPPTTAQTRINDVSLVNTQAIQQYQKAEWLIELDASFSNPFDTNDIALDAVFSDTNGTRYEVAGFWDGNTWRLRFTPATSGRWQYQLTLNTQQGQATANGSFEVIDSNQKGWLLPANKVSTNFSPRYFAYHNGEPFYGVGYGDAFAILGRFNVQRDLNWLMDTLRNSCSNYFMWWPNFDFLLVDDSHQDYNMRNAAIVDTVMERLDAEGQHTIYTVWDHSQLRDSNHPWSAGLWQQNGFSELSSIDDFFSSDTSWQSQENLYRYIIARWGYSPSILAWQTVSEIDGTNAFENTDSWHQRLNDYFVANDPYGRATTASLSGDLTWPAGFEAMDMPQVHIYQDLLQQDGVLPKVIDSAAVAAEYTQMMWQSQAKPNWIGEYGVINNPFIPSQNVYPELFHNMLWASLTAGAALSPAEWNDNNDWGIVTREMEVALCNLQQFVAPLPLAQWRFTPIQLETITQNIRGWALYNDGNGIAWIQNTEQAGQDITTIRANVPELADVQIELELPAGRYRLTPYDTWKGEYLVPVETECDGLGLCPIDLSEVTADRDTAYRIEKIGE